MKEVLVEQSEEGSWDLHEPDEVPQPAKPKNRVKLESLVMVKEMERGMPRSDDAERGVLSCFLQSPQELLGQASSSVPKEWFYHAGNRLLYEEMLVLNTTGVVDLVTLSQHLIDRHLLDKIGGPAILAELLNFVPTPAHYGYYCGILRDKHILRGVVQGSERIKESCYIMEESIPELSKLVVTEASQIISLFEESGPKEKSLEEGVMEWMEEYKLKTKGHKASAMPTRWKEFNRRMGGLDGGYTIVSGEYSAGKSVLLRNLLVDACVTNGRPGLLVNYETTIKQTISGMVCDIAGIRTEAVFRPDFNPPTASEEKAIAMALQKIAGSKLKILHDVYISADGIGYRARSMRDKYGDVVVGVDYLQKVPRPSHIEKGANQERELACNSDTLQKIAKDTGCPVVVACQLNKEGTARGSASVNMDGDTHFRIEGSEGVFVEKFKEGERHFHLPLFLNGTCLRFEEQEPAFPS